MRRRQNRDLLAIRRIFINIGILIAVGFPGVILNFQALITGVEHSLAYRIQWIGIEVGVAILSVEMVLMTPQIKNIFMKRCQLNRVNPVSYSLQQRTIGTT